MGGGFLELIKVRLMEELQTPVAFTIPLFGGIPVTLSVVVSWLVMGALILAAALLVVVFYILVNVLYHYKKKKTRIRVVRGYRQVKKGKK